MSEDTFITEGGNGPELHPVEVKDHSTDPKLTEEIKPKVETVLKKRGRPKKVQEKTQEKIQEPARKWRCSSCREIFDFRSVMKIGAGTDRYALFCPMCQRSLGFFDQVVLDRVEALIRDNPTGKNA